MMVTGRFGRGVLGCLVVVLVCLVWCGGAFAAAVPAWLVNPQAVPDVFSAGGNQACLETSSVEEASGFCDGFLATITNFGGRATNGGPVTIVDVLPVGVAVAKAALEWSAHKGEELGRFCSTVGRVVTCTVPRSYFEGVSGEKAVAPDDTLNLYVFVTVNVPEPAGETVVNSVSVEGGGAVKAQASIEAGLGGGVPAVAFGVGGSGTLNGPLYGPSDGFLAPLSGSGGLLDGEAGSHPYELHTDANLDTVFRQAPEGLLWPTSVQDVRDVVIDLPVGVVGSAAATPQCTFAELSASGSATSSGVAGCPKDTILGHIRTYPQGFIAANNFIYNMVPEAGATAELGFVDTLNEPHVVYVSLAPTPEGYVLRSVARELPQIILNQITADVYGDPGARDGSGGPGVPQLTLPEDCSGEPMKTVVYLDSWQAPGSFEADGAPDVNGPGWASKTYEAPGVTGCENLAGLFAPELTATPETTRAASPTGLDVNLKVPQQEGAEAPGTPPVKSTVVTLPEGMTVDPSSANGLQACSEGQIGWLGGSLEDFNQAPPACPQASKIGTLEVESPSLPAEECKTLGKTLSECPEPEERERTVLHGEIYVASQDENPFGTLLAIYLVFDDPRTGVLVKIPARVQANQTTGQLSTSVSDTPQFPFSELRTHFFGGNDASLNTPATCASYSVSGTVEPWSAPQSGPAVSLQSPAFAIDQAENGGACPSSPPFAPALTAGSTDRDAGAFSNFSVTFTRQGGEQTFAQSSISSPRGLAAVLANVTPCPEPQASQGDCGPESEIGEATSAVGSGPAPYWVHGGKVYLTTAYNDGPFGLTVVVPTTAGPYTLTGNGGPGREIVRASIRVNPNTAQVTVASDPLPTILEGIPLEIRTVNVTINRKDFTFNPTNCEPQTVTGQFTSTTGQPATATAPYDPEDCAALPFHPTLTATAAAQGSKLDGTSFEVDVTSPGLGQANIHKVDITIPAVLPSRLETIQKACPEQTFEANPASCDEGSIIGHASVSTPVLKTPFQGPAYLVSHAAAAFPDVEFVLQSEGIEIVLDGKTDIKNKITYSKFETAPDAPFTSFQAIFPAGPHSALTAHVPENEFYDLCHQPRITLPTELVAQNNAHITQTTTIQLQGCPNKPAIIHRKTNTHTHTLTLTIYIPQAGKLHITGKHTHPKTITTTTREPITIKLPTKPHTTINLTYTPNTNPTHHTTIKTKT
jgi:hypothetical protein